MGQQIFQADNRTSSARYIPLNHPLFSRRIVARTAPSLCSGRMEELIMRLFRGETQPSKHHFSPPSRSDLPLRKWDEAKLQVSRNTHIWHFLIWYGVRHEI